MNYLDRERCVLDREHLRLLSIAYYVLGAFGALFACIPLIHLGIGSFLMLGPGTWGRGDEAAAAFTIGAIMAFAASAIVLLGWLLAALKIYAGHCLARHRNRTFCFVVAAITCLAIPYGTIVGVLTIVVLARPSVAALFDAESPARGVGAEQSFAG
jgi:hypothetical protein